MKKYPDIKLAYPVIEAGVDADIMAMKALNGYDKAFSKLHKMGYQGVELQLRDPDNVDVLALESALTQNNLTLAAIGTSPMQKLDKLFLLGKDQYKCDACLRRAKSLISLCAHFDAVLLIGKMRGMVEDVDGCRLSDLQSIIGELAEMASAQHVRIALEPQNSTNINNLNTFHETKKFIERVTAAPGTLGFHADIYHMKISETNLLESLGRYGEMIHFIHIADTERKVPGKGSLNYVRIMETLSRVGYKGFISPEIKQLPESELVAERTIEYFERLLV